MKLIEFTEKPTEMIPMGVFEMLTQIELEISSKNSLEFGWKLSHVVFRKLS